MSQEWLVSGLHAVDSGLRLYWDVRRMVWPDEEDTRQGQVQDRGVGWSQQQDNSKMSSYDGNTAHGSCSTQQTWQSGDSKAQEFPASAEEQEMGKGRSEECGHSTSKSVQGSSSTQQGWQLGGSK
eukprot:GFUD01139273.1.p1 GENE.GFUD01139273.1~~GFUD01139273.1.p1  ORF type:complete len:125 (-),score=36.74 GFUD01139273.1:34-408(-)